MISSFQLFRFRGIPIGAHWSWLFVVALVTWSLASSLFPRAYPGLEDSTYLVMGLVASLLLFASIVLHELGHALRALREGVEIDGITLWLFGGVARFKGRLPSPGAEFRIAVAGPLVSVALAVLFAALASVGAAVGLADPATGVLDYLWRINALVVGFNLVPALPLDGGRILRAWLWHRQRSLAAATRSAGRAGMAFGIVLIALGLLDFLSGGGGGGGLWLVFLGWFLIQAAQAETAMVMLEQALRGREVRELMTADPITASPTWTIDEFFDEVQMRGHTAYPVLEGDRLVGLITLSAASDVPRDVRATRRVSEAMTPVEVLKPLQSDTDAADALVDLQETGGRSPVMDDGRLIGILSISDLLQALQVERARGSARPSSRGAGAAVWIVVALAMAAVAGLIYHPPVFVIEPGETLDVAGDITISGREVDAINGTYLLTSVRLVQPNGLEVLYAALASDREIVAASDLIPEDADVEDFAQQQRRVFDQSRQLAAAAAAEAAGLRVAIRGSGAVVEEVVSSSPAAEKLRPGDVIVAVDGRRIILGTDLADAISSRPLGTQFRITFERDGGERVISARSARLPEVGEGIPGIGVRISTRAFSVDLPFDITFEDRNIGGPSAGLAYALAIADMLDPSDYARGRIIAATGTIDFEGNVGPVGGIPSKAAAADESGSDVLLVPRAELVDAGVDGLRVQGVATLAQALRLLS